MGIRNIGALSLLNSLNRTNERLSNNAIEIANGQRSIQNLSVGALSASSRALSQLGTLSAVDSGVAIGTAAANLQQAGLADAGQRVDRIKQLTIQGNLATGSDKAAIQSALNQEVAGLNNLSNSNFSQTNAFAGSAFQTSDDTAGVISNVNINQTPGPVPAGGTQLDVTVNAVGTQAATSLTTPAAATTFELSGNEGTANINFSGGTSQQLADQINSVSAQTGVNATVNGAQVDLTSANAGQNQTISVQNVQGGGFAAGEAGQFAGTDANVTVNNVQAQTSGNTVNLNSVNGFGGSFEVDSATAAGTNTTFDVELGGSTFVTDANGGTTTIGLPSNLGLDQLTTGGSLSLNSGDLNGQLAAIDSAKSSIISSQVQLGGVQGAQSSTSASIQSQVSNLTSAISDLRGTDFASSISNLLQERNQSQVQTSLIRESNNRSSSLLNLLARN